MKIERMTVAVNRMAEMVRFYNAVFDAGLEPFGPEGAVRFHRGKLDGKTLIFCPNTIAEVDAQQNRQQFHFAVEDVDHVMQQALNNGGQEYTPLQDNGQTRSASVADPDGNTMEFIQHLS